MHARLCGETDLAGFRAEVHNLLAHQVPPDAVAWELEPPDEAELHAVPTPASASRPRNVARAATAIVPASYLRLCEFVILHRDPERFGLLYRLLWRFVHEPGLRNDAVDPDLLQAQHMAHAVRRDIHKMKAQLRFRAIAGELEDAPPLQLAWYEPAHHILEAAAPYFARRMDGQHWAILTPERSVHGRDSALEFGPGLPRDILAGANDDAVWLSAFGHAFRPLRPAH